MRDRQRVAATSALGSNAQADEPRLARVDRNEPATRGRERQAVREGQVDVAGLGDEG